MRSKRLAALAIAATVAFPVATSARADVRAAHVAASSRQEIPREGSGDRVQALDWQWRYRMVIVINGTSAGARAGTSTYGPWSEWHLGPVKLPTIAQPRNGYAYFQVQKARAPSITE